MTVARHVADPNMRRLLALLLSLGVLGLLISPPPGEAITVLQQFEGAADSDNGTFGATFTPPDNGLAVGPGHVVQMVNEVGRITDKSGNVVSLFNLNTFFGHQPGFGGSDARVIYDVSSGRWYATYMNFSSARRTSSIDLAVSSTSDPTGHFCFYRLGNPSTELFLQDYPFLGISEDKVVVSYAAFDFVTSVSLGGGYYVLNKAQLTSCVASLSVSRFAPQPATLMKPARAVTNGSTAYMAAHSNSTVTVWSINGVPGVSPVTVSTRELPMTNSWLTSPAAAQAGSTVLLDTDSRTQTVVWQNQSLWLGGNGACTPPGDTTTRSCLRLVEVRTDTMSVRQDIVFGAAGRYYFDPAVSPDGNGNLVVVFMESSSTEFLNVRATGRLATDPLNTLGPPLLLRAGEGAETSVDPDEGVARAGDFSGAAADSVDPTKVWVSAQYIKAGGEWGTYIASLTFPNPSVSLVAALLPSSRSVQVATPATVFVTVLNAGTVVAPQVGIALGTALPATLSFQALDPTGSVFTSGLNVPVDIPPSGAQLFLVAITPSAAFGPTQVPFVVSGLSTSPAPSVPGVNTLLLSATSTPAPDIIELAVTPSNDGLLSIAGTPGVGAFIVVTLNLGASGLMTAMADTGGVSLPVSVSICRMNQTPWGCLGPPGPSVTTQIGTGEAPTFGIFVIAAGPVAFNPTVSRVFVRFLDTNGVTRALTGVALRAQ